MIPQTTAGPVTNSTPTATPTSWTVSATEAWQPTNLTLRRGDKLSIRVISGSWTVNKRNSPYVAANGYPHTTDQRIHQGCKINAKWPYARLLGRITGAGTAFPLGTGETVTADANGVLTLRIHEQDSCLRDNDGAIRVALSVTTAHRYFAGYMARGLAPYNTVSARWRVPSVRCGITDPSSAVAVWIGLGGLAPNEQVVRLPQIGIWADCINARSPGSPRYYALWQIASQMEGSERIKDKPVEAGDLINAQIVLYDDSDTKKFTACLYIKNETRNWEWGYQPAVEGGQGSRTDAMSAGWWIVETPAQQSLPPDKIHPLPDFGRTTFTDAYFQRWGGPQVSYEPSQMTAPSGASISTPRRLHHPWTAPCT